MVWFHWSVGRCRGWTGSNYFTFFFINDEDVKPVWTMGTVQCMVEEMGPAHKPGMSRIHGIVSYGYQMLSRRVYTVKFIKERVNRKTDKGLHNVKKDTREKSTLTIETLIYHLNTQTRRVQRDTPGEINVLNNIIFKVLCYVSRTCLWRIIKLVSNPLPYRHHHALDHLTITFPSALLTNRIYTYNIHRIRLRYWLRIMSSACALIKIHVVPILERELSTNYWI